MIERQLLTSDELKSLPKGDFIVMKTGAHPMRTKLKLFLDWGITFDKQYEIEEKSYRKVYYASKEELEANIMRQTTALELDNEDAPAKTNLGGTIHSMLQQQADKNKPIIRT